MENIIKKSASNYQNVVSILSSSLSIREKIELIQQIPCGNSPKAMELCKGFFSSCANDLAVSIWQTLSTAEKLKLIEYITAENMYKHLQTHIHIETVLSVEVFTFLKKFSQEINERKNELKKNYTFYRYDRNIRKNFNSFLRKTVSPYFSTKEKMIDNIMNTDIEILQKKSRKIYNDLLTYKKSEQEKERLIQEFEKKTGLGKEFFGKKVTLEVLQAQTQKVFYAEVGGYYITVSQEIKREWGKYSKKWHSKYGPAKTVLNRAVGFSKGEEKHNISVSSFSGNYLYKAITEFFKLKTQKVAKELRKVQLNEFFEIEELRKIGNSRFFLRKIAGEVVDYCILHENQTFHASSLDACVKGLKEKRKALKEFEQEEINYEIVKNLGFCDTGILSFCELNNLDIHATYTRKELRNIVVKNRKENCEMYAEELRKIGISLNCK